MSLTDYEKVQFEKLTADFQVEDTSALKKMKKKDKATAMTFVALPSVQTIFLVAAVIALIFCIAGRVTGNENQTLMSGGIGIALIFASTLFRESKTRQQSETSD